MVRKCRIFITFYRSGGVPVHKQPTNAAVGLAENPTKKEQGFPSRIVVSSFSAFASPRRRTGEERDNRLTTRWRRRFFNDVSMARCRAFANDKAI